MPRLRVAFVFTHRIQYFVNVLDELARRGNVEVLSVVSRETGRTLDVGFGRTIEWDNRRDAGFQEVLLDGMVALRWIKLADTLRTFRPDVVHLNGYAESIQLGAWLCARGARIPYLLRGDGDCLVETPTWRTKAVRLALSPLVDRAKTIFFQGQENRRYWMKRGASSGQLRWIPCVPDSEVFRRPAFPDVSDRTRFRSEHGVQEGDVVFIASGKLEQRKRPLDAVDALAQLCQRGLSPRLWFLGSGPLEEALKTRAIERGVFERISWLGFRNQSELPAPLQAADVLVHLSDSDPWPYSVLEGAISGLALVLSDRTGSHPDFGPACVVFPCGDVEALVGRLSDLVSEPLRIRALGQEASRRAEEYTENTFCEILEQAAAEAATTARR